MKKRGWLIGLSALLLLTLTPLHAQDGTRPVGTPPLIMPVAGDPGPGTWLMGQPHGNTVGSFNFGQAWYSAGQGMHFGIDISMPCGTPLVAVADGEVAWVDNGSFGSAPHNLILIHAQHNVTTLYGHLLEPAPLMQGQSVTQGQLVGYSGDPDLTCVSRPHLHFEVRSMNYRTAYNPAVWINANWNTLTTIGSFQYPMFQQDLNNPRRWMSLDDQPDIAFGGARLNDYWLTSPPPTNERPPMSPPLPLALEPLPADTTWTLRPLNADGCCAAPRWHPTDPERLYIVDGTPAVVMEWDAQGNPLSVVEAAPAPPTSPDGTIRITNPGWDVTLTDAAGNSWNVVTQRTIPSISTDNTRLLWLVRTGDFVPGSADPHIAVWVSDIDGANARQLYAGQNIGAQWLDGARLLVTSSADRNTTLTIHDTRDDSTTELGTFYNLRGLSIAPGGGRLMFYLAFQPDAAANGIYVLDTTAGAQAQRLDWFGGWRWRDADSVYYIPFVPGTDVHTLAYYHIPTGENRFLTDPAVQPFTIMNGDWDVSADARRIVFQNAADRNLWVLEIAP